ncbi:MAG TPA: [FeFe] hydrogenase, group A [Fervidobacterium sp.]|nr:[FeFe] hydrogenase, group A [Fervidobacterium sp.]HQQ17673.1 [FeFe] hydrogenase, group A [Fervidobacterium sp.]
MKINVNGKQVEIRDDAKNVMEALREIGIEIPNLCYLSETSVYGACRMCLVEVDGKEIVTSCTLAPREGMSIRTHTPKIYEMRKGILQLLLASHDGDCTTCEMNGKCKLQRYARDFGLTTNRFATVSKKAITDNSSIIVRDNAKCILCGDCVRACEELQTVSAIDFAYRGFDTQVVPSFEEKIENTECVFCGQCVAYCPTGALAIRNDVDKVYKAIENGKYVIGMIAPAVRASLQEEFGLEDDIAMAGRMVSVLKMIGFKKVFDVAFSADLVAYEEAHEFLERLEKNEKLPQFTSCCPGWVKFAEQYYPEYVPNLSSVKSPQMALGAIIKKYYAKEIGVNPEDIVLVSVMPCTAKKFEAEREEFNGDVDIVLTTRELVKVFKSTGMDIKMVEPEPFDRPFGLSSQSGLSFGKTGGVLGSVVEVIADKVAVKNVNTKQISEGTNLTEIELENGRIVRGIAVFGLGNVRKIVDKLKSGELQADVVEVMACNYGCIGGGGQPYPNDVRTRARRASILRETQSVDVLISPTENFHMRQLYEKYLGAPLSHEAHETIHTEYKHRRRIQEEEIDILPLPTDDEEKIKVSVCLGTSCYTKGSYEILEKLIALSNNEEWAKNLEIKGTFCLENCGKAPNVLINDRIVGEATIEKIKEVALSEIREKQGDTEVSKSNL